MAAVRIVAAGTAAPGAAQEAVATEAGVFPVDVPAAAPVQEAVLAVMAVIMAVPAGLRLMLGLEGIRL